MASAPRFSPSAAWDEVSAILRREMRLLVAIAGVFFLLPAVLLDQVTPDMTGVTSFPQIFEALRPHLHWFLLVSLVQYVGQLAIFVLILAPGGLTVGGAIGRGFQLLPYYFLLSICTNIMTFAGLLLFIVPGLWLIARLAPSGAALVAEEHRWPFPVIARSFALTRGNALPIFAFLLIVALVYLLISVVVTFVFGAALGLAGLGMAAGQPGMTLLSILSGIVSATGTTIFTLMAVAIYRQLAADARLGRVFG